MPKVQFESYRPALDVPFLCACCMGAPEDEMALTAMHRGFGRKTYFRFGIPYCKPCIKHVRGFEISWLVGLLGGSLLVFAGFHFLQPTPVAQMPGGWILGGMLGAGVLAAILKTLVVSLFAKKGEACAGVEHAVWVSAKGFNEIKFTWTCQNEAWGNEVRKLNES